MIPRFLYLGAKKLNLILFLILSIAAIPAYAIWDVKKEEIYAACLEKMRKDSATEGQTFSLEKITIHYRSQELAKSNINPPTLYGIISNLFGVSVLVTMKPVLHHPSLCGG